MNAKLTILGCGSAAPSLIRGNTALVLEIDKHTILLDCGEGTQLQMLKFKISAFKINYIFISHLHGDHYHGLPGLVHSLSLHGRKEKLSIYGPQGISELIKKSFEYTGSTPAYPLELIELRENCSEVIKIDDSLSLRSIPLQHRIPCLGFHFEYKNTLFKLDKEKCDAENLELEAIKSFMSKQNHFRNGVEYQYEDFTFNENRELSFSFITDTLFKPSIAQYIDNTHFLYHDATFLNNLLDKAVKTYHSTAKQAAEMAILCNAQFLILGHFSSRYHDTSELLAEARSLFPQTDVAEDGKVFELK